MVRGHIVGDIEFSGPGAGGNATASAVLGDIAQACLHIARRKHRRETRLPVSFPLASDPAAPR